MTSEYRLKELKEDLLEAAPTLYCSCVSQLRGKLHMTKIRQDNLLCYRGGEESILSRIGYRRRENMLVLNDSLTNPVYAWTKEDQEELVSATLEKYRKPVAEETPKEPAVNASSQPLVSPASAASALS